MDEVAKIIEIIVLVLILCLHVFGVCVLLSAKASTLPNVQRLFFLHLSISEILIVFTAILRRATLLLHGKSSKFYIYSLLTQQGLAFPLFYLLMIFLTLDWFFAVYLSIRYPLFWSTKRTKYLITSTWCFCIIICSIFYTMKPSIDVLDAYYFPCCGIACIMTAIITYSYIAYKILRNRSIQKRRVLSLNHMQACNTRNTVATSVPTDCVRPTQRPKGFYTVGLIVLSFILFINIPDQIFSYYGRNKLPMPSPLKLPLNIMYFCAFASDFFIYILGSKSLRVIALRKLRLFHN